MKTEILKIDSPSDHHVVQKAAGLLDAGYLVAFPTETVYGIGCRVDKESLCRMDRVKGRDPDKRYTLHIGSFEQLERHVPSMSLKARKLVQNAFPGPVTIVFELDDDTLDQIKQSFSIEVFEALYSNQTIGVRYPACPVTCEILAASESPIVAPSANSAGLTPAVTAKEVLDYFDGEIESIVEIPGLELDFKQSSTVVKVGKRDIQILREGAVPASLILEWATIRILFVCTGNTCRSPMAEGFCRKFFADNLGCQVDEIENSGYIITSAGIAACENQLASQDAVQVCRESGIDLSQHQSRQLTPEMVNQNDIIMTMSRHHRDSIIRLFPAVADKCFVLNGDSDIADPIGMGIEHYRACFQQICTGIIEKKKEIL